MGWWPKSRALRAAEAEVAEAWRQADESWLQAVMWARGQLRAEQEEAERELRAAREEIAALRAAGSAERPVPEWMRPPVGPTHTGVVLSGAEQALVEHLWRILGGDTRAEVRALLCRLGVTLKEES